MKDFTGIPKINEKSRKMRRSNISQLIKPVPQYHTLCQAPKPSTRPPSHSPSRASPKPQKGRAPAPLKTFSPIKPYSKENTPKSISTPLSSDNFSHMIPHNTSQLSKFTWKTGNCGSDRKMLNREMVVKK